MGGSISVTLRTPGDVDYRMTRWTNSMPWGITNMGIVNDDPKHVVAYLKQWQEMKEDWDRNGPDGPFKHNMTEVYFPGYGLAPLGYGLVVVDMVNKVVLTCQGYCRFGAIYSRGLANNLHQYERNRQRMQARPYEPNYDDLIEWGLEDPESEVSRLHAFHEAGRMTALEIWSGPDAEKPGARDLTGVDFNTFVKEIAPYNLDYGYIMLDMSPYTIEVYDEGSPAELRRMRQRVLDLGFVLTPEEEATWEEYIALEEEWAVEDGEV